MIVPIGKAKSNGHWDEARIDLTAYFQLFFKMTDRSEVVLPGCLCCLLGRLQIRLELSEL